MTTTRVIARVVLDSRLPHLDRLLDYLVPEGMTIAPGVRVKVPLGRAKKLAPGFVVELGSASDFLGQLADIDDVVSPVPVLTPELWQLARAVADRQAGSAADVLRLAIPPRAVRVEKTWVESVTPQHPLPQSPEPSHHYSESAWQGLTELGTRHALELPPGVLNTSTGHPTTRAADTIALLAATVLAEGRSVVISVPDWRDSELLSRSLVEHLDAEHVVRLRSDDTPSARYGCYLRCLEERPVVVLGQRHALYQPVHELGLILVLAESDDSHREPLAPYPNSRDVALLRAQQQGAALVFADTVSGVDIARLVDMDYLTPVVPITRERPKVVPTALTVHGHSDPTPGRLPSLAYRAIGEALSEGPVLVQVFRSGFAPGLICTSCRERVRCDACGGPVAAASRNAARSCRWCGVTQAPRPCPNCQGVAVAPVGHGVGRTVTELGKAFPKVPVIQADGDHPVLEVPAKPALVVATRGSEPIAHGGYRGVLLLDGDKMLQRSALGALEETLRGWEWATSLAAPSAVVYLTDVEGPVVHAFAAGASTDLIAKDLRERRQLGLPPAIRIASVAGPPALVHDVTSQVVAAFPTTTVLGPVRADADSVRSLLRFPYADGPAVTKHLRAAVVAHALKGKRSERLRIIVDDVGTLDQISSTP